MKAFYPAKFAVPPRIYPSPPDGNYVVRADSNVELACNAEGSPKPTITWRRRVRAVRITHFLYCEFSHSTARFQSGNDGLLPSGAKKLSGASLSLPAVERFDAGVYECRADNGVGKPAKAEVNLQVICECIN